MSVEKTDTSIIEQNGLLCLKLFLSGTEIDTGFIREGDKEPVWDGNIYVYDSINERKVENLLFRVPVQLKASKSKNPHELEKSKIYHRMEKKYLERYFEESGVLLIKVVFIDVNNYSIYVKDLLSIDLEKLINDGRKKPPIKLVRKDSNESFLKFCHYFNENKKMQPSINLGIDVPDKPYKGMHVTIDWRDVVPNKSGEIEYDAAKFYWNKEDGSVIPLKNAVFSTTKKIEGYVKVDDKLFYNEYSFNTGSHGRDFRIGNGLLVYVEKKDFWINLKSIEDRLNIMEQINDFLFVLDFVTGGTIYVKEGHFRYDLFSIKKRKLILNDVLMNLQSISDRFNGSNLEINRAIKKAQLSVIQLSK